jgi:hypothetical protein
MARVIGEEKAMRLLALAFTLLLAHFAVASAQTATPDTENGRYSFYPVAEGVLRQAWLDCIQNFPVAIGVAALRGPS